MLPLEVILRELETCGSELAAAQAHYAEVLQDVTSAKANLEYLRAEALQRGVEGKNAEQREAALRLELAEPHAELAALELELLRVKGRLDVAQTAFTVIRYKVRAMEALREVA